MGGVSMVKKDDPRRIVQVAFDASGTYLAAITASGDAAVFELKYVAGERHRDHAVATPGVDFPTRQKDGIKKDTKKEDGIGGLWSAWTQGQQTQPQPQQPAQTAAATTRAATYPPAGTPAESSRPGNLNLGSTTPTGTGNVQNKSQQQPSSQRPTTQNLTVTLPIPTSRFAYPRQTHHTTPTALAIDPSYKRKREKCVMVGFQDGRLILTKRGMLFSRRNDSVLYQGLGGDGIETVAWRGGLVAWADSSGIKLFDVEDMIRIAHIDRPSGARAALYPTISDLRPTLLFERSDSLLIAWGDCIMSMSIKERQVRKVIGGTGGGEGGGQAAQQQSGAAAAPGLPGGGGSPKLAKRRTVECRMAWELDCVACGAVPLDGEHWAVLGLVPNPFGDDATSAAADANDDGLTATPNGGNTLELQILSRSAGRVIAADALPLLSAPPPPSSADAGGGPSPAAGGAGAMVATDSGIEHSLVSSYSTPRMDDATEAEEDRLNSSVEEYEKQIAIFETMAGRIDGSGSAEEGGEGGGGGGRLRFLDPHAKWTIENVRFKDDDDDDVGDGDGEDDESAGSAVSVYSDDYNFLFRPRKVATDRSPAGASASMAALPIEPPFMVVASARDLVLARTRDIDDAISHARSGGRHGLALRRALRDRRLVRRHSLHRLIDEYLSALLRLERPLAVTGSASQESSLTVSRLRLAAKATPILLGGHVEMWRKWVHEFATIPGGLFVLREYLPVRDPRLPPQVYEMALEKMFSELEAMIKGCNHDAIKIAASSPLHRDAKELYLKTLRAWGPTSSLRERIKLHRLFTRRQIWHERNVVSVPEIEQAKADLFRRRNQTAAGYLQSSSTSVIQRAATADEPSKILGSASSLTFDSLFNIEQVVRPLKSRLAAKRNQYGSDEDMAVEREIASLVLQAMAELEFMKGNYEETVRLLLTVGAQFSMASLSDIEKDAVGSVNTSDKDGNRTSAGIMPDPILYHYILSVIESHHLHWCLLDRDLLSMKKEETEIALHPDEGEEREEGMSSPIIALIRLVGLDLSGRFLVDHCVLPPASKAGGTSGASRSATLPIDMVASQLRPRPKLLHWYLQQIFLHKPDVYVKFPSTAVPPRAITELHRIHLELHVKYALDNLDKDRKLTDIPAYDDVDIQTPLMAFLKAALPFGGTRPDDVRRMLEVCREGRRNSPTPGHLGPIGGPIGSVKHPHLFARELAYVIEHCGSGTEEDARTVLQLYLEGAKSLPLAVGYAERNVPQSGMLWETLVSYCLDPKPQLTRSRETRESDTNAVNGEGGALFGALLEVAARSGADLAQLVSKIPEGMRIEGLRPRLVAAIVDYRLKLKIHEAAADVLTKDKVALLRELSHRSRRGLRVVMPPQNEASTGSTSAVPSKSRKISRSLPIR